MKAANGETMSGDMVLFFSVLAGWGFFRKYFHDLEKRKLGVEKNWRKIEPAIKSQCRILNQLLIILNQQLEADCPHQFPLFEEANRKKQWPVNFGLSLESQLYADLKKVEAMVEKIPKIMVQQSFLQYHRQLICLEKQKNRKKERFIRAAILYNKKFRIFPMNIIAPVLQFKKICLPDQEKNTQKK